jgi:hypothetical protein
LFLKNPHKKKGIQMSFGMLSSLNISSMSVIVDIRNAIFCARQEGQQIQVDIAGIQLTVNPDSNLSEVVSLWETEFENRKK